MKIDFGKRFREMDGKEAEKTLKDIVCPLLAGLIEQERALSAEERFKRGALAYRIYNAEGEVELKTDEITMIKKVVGMGCPPFLVWQAWNMLEGDDANKTA